MATIRHQVLIDAQVAKCTGDFHGGRNQHLVGQTNAHPNRSRLFGTQSGSGAWRGAIESGRTSPNKRVEWECISTHPKGSPASAWTGTHFIFEITERNNIPSSGSNPNQIRATTLDFCQDGYDERSEFFEFNKSRGARYCKT